MLSPPAQDHGLCETPRVTQPGAAAVPPQHPELLGAQLDAAAGAALQCRTARTLPGSKGAQGLHVEEGEQWCSSSCGTWRELCGKVVLVPQTRHEVNRDTFIT